MKKHTAYFDCSSGISGDMLLGACVDAGASLQKIKNTIGDLKLKGVSILAKKTVRHGLGATKITVNVERHNNHHHEHAKYIEIDAFIKAAKLEEEVKDKTREIFQVIARAEAKVHNESLKTVHFHELGNPDTIVDVVGTLVALKELGVNNIVSSAINIGGTGKIETSHGLLSNPAPATVEILKGMPVYFSSVPFELVTPTGAAILRVLTGGAKGKRAFTSVSPFDSGMFKIKSTGYGAGERDFPDIPNVLRIIVGTNSEESLKDEIIMLETNIDDTLPVVYDTLMEKLFKTGALDVFFSSIQMKKNRPAVKVEVMCVKSLINKICKIIFLETATFGIRFYPVSRIKLEKKVVSIKTKWGAVRIKIGRAYGKIVSISPEYDDCKRISLTKNVPLKVIIETAKNSFKPENVI